MTEIGAPTREESFPGSGAEAAMEGSETRAASAHPSAPRVIRRPWHRNPTTSLPEQSFAREILQSAFHVGVDPAGSGESWP